MRTQLIGLVFLGLTSLTQAQKNIETDVEAESVDLKNIIISSNSRYMNNVYDENSSQVVKQLEQIVAGYDIKSNDIFSPDYENYSVNFNTATSTKVSATYHKNGTILSSIEQYDDILLPHAIRQKLVKDYPGWTLHSNSYRVVYDKDKDIKKLYKIQVRKAGNKKNLKINVEGNMAIVSVDYE